MANPNVRVINLNQITLYGQVDQTIEVGPCLDDAGAPLDLSAFNAINLTFSQTALNGSVLNLNNIVATGDADGMVTVPVTSSDADSVGTNGAAQSQILVTLAGKNLVGDPFMILGTGTARFIQAPSYS